MSREPEKPITPHWQPGETARESLRRARQTSDGREAAGASRSEPLIAVGEAINGAVNIYEQAPDIEPEPPPSPKAGDHEHHPTTKTLDYLGLGIILAPAPEVIAMYLRHEDIDWQRVATSFVVSIIIGSAILWFAHGWHKTAGGLAAFRGRINRADDYFVVRAAIIAFFMIVPVLIAPLVSGAPVQPGFTQQQVDEKIAAATTNLAAQVGALQKQLSESNRAISLQQTKQITLTPEQQDFQALLQINKNLTPGDRQRLSDALFDFSKFLDLTNEVYGKANQYRAEYLRIPQTDPSQIGNQTKKLGQIALESMELKSKFDSVRLNWKFYRRQFDYVFGSDPDNNILKLYNGVTHIQNFLEQWLRIDNTNGAATALLGYPITTYDQYLTGFIQCGFRL